MTALVNNLKTVLLLGGLTGLLVGAGALMGERFVLPMLVIAVLVNLGAWFFSDRIAIAAMQGRELDESTGGDLYRMVDDLRRRAGLPMPRVYLCPHQAPNAFATGRSPRRAAVAFTQGAVNLLDRDEMAGVIAHELAHIKNRDTLISAVAATIAGVLAYLAHLAFFIGAGSRSNPLAAIAIIIFAPIAAAMIKASISRSREFVADAHGASIAGTPHGLVSALRKLEAYSRRVPLDQPNPAMNNMFIVEPMMGSSLLRLFATHPETETRVAALLRGR